MSKKIDLKELPDWPRLLPKRLAAAYCSMSEAFFSENFPLAPKKYGSKELYDRTEIDKVINGSFDANDWTEVL